MNVYDKYILPYLIHFAGQSRIGMGERRKIVPQASGVVLEVGAGSGLNIPLYGPAVTILYALDPSRELWNMAERRARRAPFPVTYLQASAERIPLPDGSIDTVLVTWTFCTIPDPARALQEITRVLKPAGVLRFIEHGRSPDPSVAVWQHRLNPMWKRLAGGCHLNRRIDELLKAAGFRIIEMHQGYHGSPKLLTYLSAGAATPPTRERITSRST